MRKQSLLFLLLAGAVALAPKGAVALDAALRLSTPKLQYTGVAGVPQGTSSLVLRTQRLEYTGVAGLR
jgi:hypothetical protein